MRAPVVSGPYWLNPLAQVVRRAAVSVQDHRAVTRAATRPVLPLGERVRRLLGDASDEPERLTHALALALSEEAGDVGEVLAQQLEADLPAMSAGQRARSAPVICSWHTHTGHQDAALALASAYRADLLATTEGVNALTSFDDERVAPPGHTLPDGHLNLAYLQQRLDRGDIRPDALASLLAWSPAATVLQPELCLLTHQAEQRRRPKLAHAAFTAYFHSQGVAAPRRDGQGIAGYHVPSPRACRHHAGPLVSVLMAAFDSAQTIVPAIDSLLAQDHPHLEVLVCDDASRDGTLSLLESHYGANPRVRVFSSSANQGPYNIRNALLREARGSVVAYHDADDLALPSRISSQLRLMQSHKANVCFTNWVRVRPSGVVQIFRDQGVRRLSLISLMAHRGVIEATGGFRSARFGADREFYLRLVDSPSVQIARVRAPQLLGLWSPQSLTQVIGSESLANGFRSTSRRAYGAAVFQQRVLGRARVSDADVDAVLQQHHVHIAAAVIRAL